MVAQSVLPVRAGRRLIAWPLDSVADALCRASLWTSSLAVIVLLLIGTLDVVGTQLLGRAVPSAIELQEAFAAVLIFTGFTVAQQQRAHLTVDLVTERLSPPLRRAAELLSLTCTTAAFLLLTLQAYALAQRSVAVLEDSPGFLSFPVYPFKVIACLACAATVVECVRQFARLLVGAQPVTGPVFDQKEILP